MKRILSSSFSILAVITCFIVVLAGCKKEPSEISVRSVSVDPTTLSLNEGTNGTLIATIIPEDATNKAVTWSSDDPAVATVSDGIVTSVAPGTATITVTTDDGGKTATCVVTVNAKLRPVSGVIMEPTTLTITEGETGSLKATVLPENATNKNITWSSDKENVATVEDGTVTAIAPGTATITVKTEDGEKTATCKVTVIEKVYPVTGISVDPATLEIKVGATSTIKAIISPDNATNKSVVWSSSAESVATVANGVVTGVSAGTADITAKTVDGDKTAVCKVTVKPNSILVTSITLSETSLDLKVGEEATLSATILPSNASESGLNWSSSQPSVATVDNGKVTAVAVGTTTITATAKDGSNVVSNACLVTVAANIPLGSVDLGVVVNGKTIYWATCNLGATSPEEYGNYYSWAETETKEVYFWGQMKYGTGEDGASAKMTKYCTNAKWGTVDGKSSLDPEDDAAHVILGGNWRLPTDPELTALRDNCDWLWTTLNDVNGYVVSNKNDSSKSIFLPAGGSKQNTGHNGVGTVGYYWGNGLRASDNRMAYGLYFNSTSHARNANGYARCLGFMIRPVTE